MEMIAEWAFRAVAVALSGWIVYRVGGAVKGMADDCLEEGGDYRHHGAFGDGGRASDK